MLGLPCPMTRSLTAVGDIAPTAAIGYERVLDGTKTQFVAVGEQICALQYREVSHGWRSSKEGSSLTPSKRSRIRWTAAPIVYRLNIHAPAPEDQPDILEVWLGTFKQPEGDWEKEDCEDGEVVLIRPVEESDGF